MVCEPESPDARESYQGLESLLSPMNECVPRLAILGPVVVPRRGEGLGRVLQDA